MVHRDVKPANLLLDPRGTVWVADFGLAKSADADDLTHAGDVVGTLRYLAPERFDGVGDHRADVYALGLTLYELLTLTPAFAAENRAKLVEQVLAASPPAPRSIDPLIPRDLETVVLKAIARDPAMRYQTASARADDLRRYLDDRAILARRASSAEQAWRWCRRNKAVASLLAVVLLVFAAGAVTASFFAVRAGEEAGRARAEEDKALLALDAETRAKSAETAAKNRLLASQEEQQANQYLWDMQMALLVVEKGTLTEVRRLLDRHLPGGGAPDRRCFEWFNWDRQLNPPDPHRAAPLWRGRRQQCLGRERRRDAARPTHPAPPAGRWASPRC